MTYTEILKLKDSKLTIGKTINLTKDILGENGPFDVEDFTRRNSEGWMYPKGSDTSVNIIAKIDAKYGDFWIGSDNGHGYIYSGTKFVDMGVMIGLKGDKGDRGRQGLQGIQGEQGIQGRVGAPGANGVDGMTPVYDFSIDGTNLVVTLIDHIPSSQAIEGEW